MNQEPKKKMFKVLSPMEKRGGGTYWMRCGVGYENKDFSLNLYIEALPLQLKTGPLQLQIREYTDEEMRESRERAEQRRSSGGSAGAGGGYASRAPSGFSGSYAARGTLGSSRSSVFDTPPLDPSHAPMIPRGEGADASSLDNTPF